EVETPGYKFGHPTYCCPCDSSVTARVLISPNPLIGPGAVVGSGPRGAKQRARRRLRSKIVSGHPPRERNACRFQKTLDCAFHHFDGHALRKRVERTIHAGEGCRSRPPPWQAARRAPLWQ